MREVKPPGEEFDAWFDVVLRQNQIPFWLTGDAPENDVVLSSRARIMRNIAGFPFPHRCTRAQLETIQSKTRIALPFAERHRISEAERAMLLGSRLVSPDFDWHKPGRSIFLNANRSVSVMVNEEDHLRIQAVTPGFSLGLAQSFTSKVESSLKGTMHFAQDSSLGYLAASPSNCGEGTRLGVMLQLAGLAHSQTIPNLGKDIEIRGLHGETSSGFGAFVQVSSTGANPMELEAAVKLLIAKERGARRQIEPEELAGYVASAREQIDAEDGLTLQETINILSTLRLGTVYGQFERTPREMDAVLAILSFGPPDEPTTNLRRARLMRRFLSSTLPWSPSYQ